MNEANRTTIVIFSFAIIGYFVSFFIPIFLGWTDSSPTTLWELTSSVLYALLHIGAAILFLAGISAYKAKLRVAYIAIATGIILVGIGLAQVVFLNIFDLIQTPWVQYGGVTLPFVLAGLAIYFGTRLIAKLVGISSLLTKPWFIFPLLLVCIVLATLMPHGDSSSPELYFDIASAINVWDFVLYAVSLGLVLQIKKSSGAHYTESMMWLAVGLTGSVVITLGIVLGTFVTGEIPAGYILDILVTISGLLYIKAAHSFVKTKAVQTHEAQTTTRTSLELDIVVYVASLASRPADIDVTLDTVRLITSRLRPGQALLPADKHALATVYQKLEKYLMHDDPLRTFSQEELRSGITKKFKLTDKAWALLRQKNYL